MKGHLVAALVHPPVSTFEFGCVAEIFGGVRRDLDVDWYDFAVGAMKPGPVASTGGIDLHVPHGPELFEAADTIVVPCWDAPEEPPAELAACVRAAWERGARLLSICSGAFVLAAAGVLDGRRATTHWIHAEALRRRHPAVEVSPDVLYIDEGRVVTGAGAAAGLDMMLHVVRRVFHGSEVHHVLRLVAQVRAAVLVLVSASLVLPDVLYYWVMRPETFNLSYGARHLLNPFRTLLNWPVVESRDWSFVPQILGSVGLLAYISLIDLSSRTRRHARPSSLIAPAAGD